jgi:hypothetical protein
MATFAGTCGREAPPETDYRVELEEIARTLDGAADQTFSLTEVQDLASLGDVAGKLREAIALIEAALDDMGRLEPPSEVQELHGRLMKGWRDFADALEEFAAAGDAGDVATLNRLAARAAGDDLPGMQEIRETVRRFHALGYDL